MNKTKIIIWGASGHAKVLREFLGKIGYDLIALFDNNTRAPRPFDDVPLYYGREAFLSWAAEHRSNETACLVAIGGARGRARMEIQSFLAANGIKPATAIHPTAYVASNAVIAAGSQILAHSTVCANTLLGEACIINTGATVDHECMLGKGVHVAPGAILAGCVKVGDFSLIGPGAVVLPRLAIGTNSIVGAGAVVTREVPDNKVVYGNPARIIRENLSEE